jgi:hypothetical protein
MLLASLVLAAGLAGYPTAPPCYAAPAPVTNYYCPPRAPVTFTPYCPPTHCAPQRVAFAPAYTPAFAASYVAAPPKLQWWDDYDAAHKQAVWASKPLVIWFDEFTNPQWASGRILPNLSASTDLFNATLLYVGGGESGQKIRQRFGIPSARAVVTLEPSGQYQWFQWAGTIPDSEINWLFGAIGSGKPAFGTTVKSPHSNTADAVAVPVTAGYEIIR